MWGWTRPRGPVLSTDMDHASHIILAMCGAEVRVIAAANESVLIDRSAIGKNSSVAVGIIRRTKLFIGNARSAAGDAMATADPRPSHCVAYVDADFDRHKRETLPDGHIENLAGTKRHTVRHWLPVLVDNSKDSESALFLCRESAVSVSRVSLRQKYCRKHQGDPKSASRS